MNAPPSIAVPHVADIINVDGEAVVVLPPAVSARLGVGLGDVLELVEDGDRLLLRRKASARPDQIAVMHDVMTRRRKALAELAKSHGRRLGLGGHRGSH
jgi:bifunctional DNA-binding transcriptional regulator/antitoxin component of YhaV-PrlF toxin-antitoxin module